jgi:hypothetical protein
MGKDLPGLSPLWLISLALVLGVFLATALPLVVLTKDALPGDWLGFAGAIIGAGCTIFAGWLAYSAVQVQIKDYRDAARQTAFSALDEQVMTNSRDIDRLVLAAAFLNTFAEPFPPTHNGASTGGFTDRLRQSRMKALDFVSASATNAPYGYGSNISTVMTRIQRLGDRIDDQSSQLQWAAVSDYFDESVKDAIAGIRAIAAQIEGDIPVHRQFLERLMNDRNRFS